MNKSMQPRKVGLALGGGGAKGLAHIRLLKTLDELGIQATQIAGTSIGAIIAVLYASGKTGQQIEDIYHSLFVRNGNFWSGLFKREESLGIHWYDLLSPGFRHQGGLISIDGFLDFLIEEIGVTQLEELKIPIQIVAADFWNRKAVIFKEGDIKTALLASVALAGIFAPVQLNGQILVDGGAVNPVPFDLLDADCDLTIAINVLGEKKAVDGELVPNLFEALFNTYQIMEESIVQEKLKQHSPDIYLKPDIRDVRVLDFHKYEEVYAQTASAVEELQAALSKSLNCLEMVAN